MVPTPMMEEIMTQAEPRITIAEFEQLAADKLPLVTYFGIRAETIEAGRVVMRLPSHDDHLRPGGTVSGPVMVALADVAVYALVLGLVGPVELAVTTNLTANFLRLPRAVDLIAEGIFDRMVAWQNRQVIDVPIADAIAEFRAVDVDGALVRTARGLGICLGD